MWVVVLFGLVAFPVWSCLATSPPPCGVGPVVVLVGPAPPVWGSVFYIDMVWLLPLASRNVIVTCYFLLANGAPVPALMRFSTPVKKHWLGSFSIVLPPSGLRGFVPVDAPSDIVRLFEGLSRSESFDRPALVRSFEKIFCRLEDLKIDAPMAEKGILEILQGCIATGCVDKKLLSKLPETLLRGGLAGDKPPLGTKCLPSSGMMPLAAGAVQPGTSVTRPTKLFIGGITRNTTTKQLRDHFAAYGRVLDCVAMRQSDGRPRGFGYVTLDSPQAAELCLAAPQVIDGRVVDMKRAVPEGDMDSAPTTRLHTPGTTRLPPGLVNTGPALRGPPGLEPPSPTLANFPWEQAEAVPEA
eukprot:s155_g13.t1